MQLFVRITETNRKWYISIKVNNELRLFPLRQHADICHSSVIQVVSFSVALHAGR